MSFIKNLIQNNKRKKKLIEFSRTGAWWLNKIVPRKESANIVIIERHNHGWIWTIWMRYTTFPPFFNSNSRVFKHHFGIHYQLVFIGLEFTLSMTYVKRITDILQFVVTIVIQLVIPRVFLGASISIVLIQFFFLSLGRMIFLSLKSVGSGSLPIFKYIFFQILNWNCLLLA